MTSAGCGRNHCCPISTTTTTSINASHSAGLADKIEKAGVRQKRKPVSELGEDQERIAKKIKKAFPLDAAVAGAGRSGAAGLDCEVYDSKGLRSQLTDLEVKAGAFLDADSIATRAGQRGTLPGAVFKLQQELPALKATKTVCDSSLKSDEEHSKKCRWLNKQQRQGLLTKEQAKDVVELLNGFLDSRRPEEEEEADDDDDEAR
jgi:hypothetical protein